MKKVTDDKATSSKIPRLFGKTSAEELPTPHLQRSTSPTRITRASRIASGASSVSSSTSTVTSSGPLPRAPFKSVSQNTPAWKSVKAGTTTPPSVSSKQDTEKQPRLGLVQELMDTRKENSAVKSSNSQLKEELTKYKSVVQSLETQGFALQSHCTVADETKLVTSKVLQNLTQQLLAERAEKNEFKEMLEQEGIELQSVIADKDQLQKRLQELLQRVNELEVAMQALEKARNELDESKMDMEASKQHLQTELTSSRAAAQRSEARKKEMEMELEAAHDEITAMHGAIDNIKSSMARANAARETAEIQLAALMADRSHEQEAHRAEIEQMHIQVHAQAELLRARDMQIIDLQAQLAQASQALQDLPRQLSIVNNALADARKELAMCGARKKKPSLVFKLLTGALGVVSTLVVQRLHSEWGPMEEQSKEPRGVRLLFWRVSVSKA
ncbi:g7413 [Coccomyxa elongata]